VSGLLLRDLRLPDGAAADLLIEAGRIAAIGPALAAPAGTAVEPCGGALALPGLIEGHTHLDKTLLGLPWHRNEVGPRIRDKIDNERRFRAASGHDAAAQSLALARAFLAAGTTRIRTHVDIDTDAGLAHLRGVLATRAALAGPVEIQIVAFPQSGLLIRPGTAELLDAALAEGADAVGGLDPCAIDRDPVGHLNAVFGLAGKHAKPVDIHLHEPGEMGAFSLDLIIERTEALGLSGRVVVSHAFCLGGIGLAERDALLARMARAGIAIATTAPASRPVPLVAACRAQGVTIFGGNDGIRDTWTPYGAPDMLERAMLIGLRNDFRRDEEIGWALDCVTGAAAAGCGFPDYGLAPGRRADLVLLDAPNPAAAVVLRPPRRLVVSAGRIVARDGALAG
jgi:cytosine deaminase